MSDVGDYPSDMARTPLSDRDIDALFEGRQVGDAALEAVVRQLRAVASEPAPSPAADLALLFERGLATRNVHEPAARTAGLLKGRRSGTRMLPRILAGLVAKLGALGVTAKAALAVTAASASVTVAGVAGVLPQEAHDALERVIPVEMGALNDEGDGGVVDEERAVVDERDEETVVDEGDEVQGGDIADDGDAARDGEGRPEQPGAASRDGLDRAHDTGTPAAGHVPSSTGPGTGDEMRERNTQAPADAGTERKPESEPAAGGEPAAEHRPENAPEPGSGNAGARPGS